MNRAISDAPLGTTVSCTLQFSKNGDGSDKESIDDNRTEFDTACMRAAPRSGKIYLFKIDL